MRSNNNNNNINNNNNSNSNNNNFYLSVNVFSTVVLIGDTVNK